VVIFVVVIITMFTITTAIILHPNPTAT
jgi:hypothetical protein